MKSTEVQEPDCKESRHVAMPKKDKRSKNKTTSGRHENRPEK
jgi:hypothetical protein